MNWTVHCADVLAWCEDYAAKIERGEAEPFMGILTDPSYGLGDNPDIEALLTAWMSGEDYDTGPGFMSRDWDQLPSPRYWRALRRVCHPGAYLFAFGGTRTADLLSVALRLAGWERFDEIDVLGGSISWIQGSGFPKSTAIGKAIDRAANAEREVIGTNSNINGRISGGIWAEGIERLWKDRVRKGDTSNANITAPATPLAARFDGWGTAAKPAHEPVLAFRNPLAKVPSDRIHAVTGWDWWHSEKLLKDTPQTRLKILKKYGCRLPPLYGEADLVLITRKALHEDVETDKLFVARAKRQWRAVPTEPVTLARVDVKAYRRWSSKTYAANCLSTGAGGLWIDGSRVATGEDDKKGQGGRIVEQPKNGKNPYSGGYHTTISQNDTQGRWPPNVCLSHVPPRPDGNGGWLPGCERLGVKRVRGTGMTQGGGKTPIYGSGENITYHASSTMDTGQKRGYKDPDGLESVTAYACVLACDGCGHQWTAEQRGACPECGGEARWACAVAELGEQSGERAMSGRHGESGNGHKTGLFGMGSKRQQTYWDKGTAARFYPQFTWQHEIAERLAGVVPFRYCAKSARAERDVGLDGIEPQITRVVHNQNCRECPECGRHYPNSTKKCECGGKLITAEVSNPPRRNPHPTVKPIALCKWLATLILPPPEYAPRRVLIPFGGVMSEAIGAGLAGWDEIVAIEMEEEYIPIGEARLRFWADWAARGYDDPAAILNAAKKEEKRCEEAQMELL